jgi:hypothetical protein
LFSFSPHIAHFFWLLSFFLFIKVLFLFFNYAIFLSFSFSLSYFMLYPFFFLSSISPPRYLSALRFFH